MAGKIHMMIEKIVRERAKGDPIIESTTKTKLILKGFDPNKFSATSADDLQLIVKLKQVASDLGVSL